MQFARINDLMIHYQIIGAPADKPTIVFANALGTDFRIWRDVIVRLAGDFAIVLYDKRGHGLSDVGQTPYAIEDHAGDLAGLLDMLSVSNAYICGLSVGGLIAQSLYQRRPELVRGLILCGTAPRIGTPDLWNDRIAAVKAGGIEALADGIMERWFTEEFRRPENTAYAGYRNMLVRQPAEGYVATCEALRDADYETAATSIAVPTICVAGGKDGSTPPDVVLAMAKRIPDARYELIRDAGHIACVEQPALLTEIIKAFIAEVETGK
ncbi:MULTISPECIES: 3-oxoadipate enol-lactonase [unclassified Rhizobium]|uniref:3-oxoadipate enol-lactonase n=1 Tax=unclassified Rhizobium TaxID=2613769 RepID=UPI001ADB7D65|nr:MULTISPECIES: 3-oxoadipate enol-lactonase [unclassified Rhizobium]MBO9098448.1 3-oxoadipate enol-lactonase [Rhizobium sp. L58/93]MBO9132748.1 3-oxoadipate enol-lactonase [Rhizobium sp. B209b/85]MBO9168714.1 3-oxoadipate enol-lactonase [Rhizobium sp. L245/93]MBO9184664.1 3-oxoadipate enol-lactonase [Rhizobium sp. E27B/91]QXZ84843.1 3-oxoadipate enol-lactonase [Rhizobium sp. K1/93]